MFFENWLTERTDNWKEFRGKTEGGFFGLSLPWTFTISALFGKYFPNTAIYFRDNQVGSRNERNLFFLFFLILWKFVYRYSFTTRSIVSFTKSFTLCFVKFFTKHSVLYLHNTQEPFKFML